MRTIFPILLSYLVLAASGCGADLTLPADSNPARLQAVSGSGQQGTVGTRLPDPLVVRLTDAAGREVANVPVEFRFQGDIPGAQFEPSIVPTDDTGFASVRVVLGTTAGDQIVEATVGSASSLQATFGITAVAAKPDGPGKGGPGKPGKGHGPGRGDHD
jgi:hypothetical protein